MSLFTAISPDKLWRRIARPKAPVLIDVRTEEDFAADPAPGAGRHAPPGDRGGGLGRRASAAGRSSRSAATATASATASPPGCARRASPPRRSKAASRPGPPPGCRWCPPRACPSATPRAAPSG